MMEAKSINRWTLNQTHALYEACIDLKNSEFKVLDQVLTAASKAPLLKSMTTQELQQFCELIHRKVEGSKKNLECLMNDYKSTQTAVKNELHDKVSKVLEEYFFGTSNKIKKSNKGTKTQKAKSLSAITVKIPIIPLNKKLALNVNTRFAAFDIKDVFGDNRLRLTEEYDLNDLMNCSGNTQFEKTYRSARERKSLMKLKDIIIQSK